MNSITVIPDAAINCWRTNGIHRDLSLITPQMMKHKPPHTAIAGNEDHFQGIIKNSSDQEECQVLYDFFHYAIPPDAMALT